MLSFKESETNLVERNLLGIYQIFSVEQKYSPLTIKDPLFKKFKGGLTAILKCKLVWLTCNFLILFFVGTL